jgi:hypothetical protein
MYVHFDLFESMYVNVEREREREGRGRRDEVHES